MRINHSPFETLVHDGSRSEGLQSQEEPWNVSDDEDGAQDAQYQTQIGLALAMGRGVDGMATRALDASVESNQKIW